MDLIDIILFYPMVDGQPMVIIFFDHLSAWLVELYFAGLQELRPPLLYLACLAGLRNEEREVVTDILCGIVASGKPEVHRQIVSHEDLLKIVSRSRKEVHSCIY